MHIPQENRIRIYIFVGILINVRNLKHDHAGWLAKSACEKAKRNTLEYLQIRFHTPEPHARTHLIWWTTERPGSCIVKYYNLGFRKENSSTVHRNKRVGCGRENSARNHTGMWVIQIMRNILNVNFAQSAMEEVTFYLLNSYEVYYINTLLNIQKDMWVFWLDW